MICHWKRGGLESTLGLVAQLTAIMPVQACRPALLQVLTLAAVFGPTAFTRRLRAWQTGAT